MILDSSHWFIAFHSLQICDLCALFSIPYRAAGWEVQGRWWGAVGLSADQLECRPYVAGIPRMWAGLGELTNLKTQSGDRMSRAEE